MNLQQTLGYNEMAGPIRILKSDVNLLEQFRNESIQHINRKENFRVKEFSQEFVEQEQHPRNSSQLGKQPTSKL